MKWAAMTSEARESFIRDNPDMSYGMMADALDTTRGAVIGFANRSGFRRRDTAKVGALSEPHGARNLRRAAKKRPVAALSPTALLGEPVTLMALEPHHCRWPIVRNSAGLWTFCAASKADERYCAVHAAVARDAYQPASQRIEKPVDYGTRKAAPEPVEPDAFDVLRDDADEIAAEPHVRTHTHEGVFA